ncbi:potassium transporter TrkA [Halomicroarcula sp. S1AR25-4]|uniref:cation:proton antiporter regulatory subunit n=1 Tax=Haloarcula sp. S1AR25-4 TaxID=2950538 RepID=UPI0028749FFB|nr:TrkA C-terminal domain-containing protein [Halomicroarcula sp. S1AR25-4]MDS0278292.1 potassium transporter TrkA [Halomicroarcula sp. S1AR25-4]
MTPATPLQGGVVLQSGLRTDDPLVLGAQLLGLGIAAASAAGMVAMGYRWYVRERVPTGLGVLFGLSAVALYLGTTGSLGDVILGKEQVLASSDVLPNLAAFAVGGAAALTGTKVGDRLGTDLFAATGGRDVDADVSEIVQTVGRVTSVHLPEEIADIVGYDPMPDATKAQLAERRFLFPRRLTKGELRDRLVTRLKTDYGVGHVDVEFGDDGDVSYLAVGSRAAGIGPTLPPSTNAVAVRADPAHAASSGDLVQVWADDPPKRVLTGELRGIADEVVTVAIDAADTPKLDPAETYKLVTLPVQDRPDREFASLLRAADETMGTVTVEAGSDLVGTTVGSLGVTVAAITRDDASPETIPSRDRVLAAGDVIYAIATPDGLRRVETAGTAETEPRVSDAADEPPTDDAQTAAPDPDEERADADPDSAVDTDDAQTAAGTDSAEVPVETDSDSSDADDERDDSALLEDGTSADAESVAQSHTDADDTIPVWDPDEQVDAADISGTDDSDGDAARDDAEPADAEATGSDERGDTAAGDDELADDSDDTDRGGT